MGIVKRTITYPDGRVIEEIIDMTKKVASKKDGTKSKPKETRKPARKALTTTSKS